MVKVISQETFDAAVKENMEEFGLDAEEARKDAVQQFLSQGVDLSNIITDPPGDNKDHQLIGVLKEINNLLDSQENDKHVYEKLTTLLKNLEMECKIDLAHRILAEKNSAFEKILKCFQQFGSNDEIKLQCLKCLVALTEGYPDILTHDGTELLINVIADECSTSTLNLTLTIIRQCCFMHERNRELLMTQFQLAQHISRLLNSSSSKNDSEIISHCCKLICTIVADDDVRVEFGGAHEYACTIAERENGLSILTTLLSEFEAELEVVNDLLSAISKLAVRNEFCQRVVEFGGLKATFDIITKHYDSKELLEKCFFLLKALAGNDDVKREIAKQGGITLIAASLNRHKSVPSVAEAGCAAVAAICLRVPENAALFVENGIAQILVDILKIHIQKIKVERQASSAIRNIVSRRKDLAPVFLDIGIEGLLQNALTRKQKAPVNEIKSALRDLGCKVHLDEQWTGKGVAVTN